MGIDSPEQVFSLAAALVIIPIIVAHIKPALRRVFPLDGPWELVADLVGVAWALGIWQAGYAPDWIDNVWAAAMTGVVLGLLSGQVRDATQLARTRVAQVPPQAQRNFVEPLAPLRE